MNNESLIEEKDNEIFVLTPPCDGCKELPMVGFYYEFYKDPNFTQYTEAVGSFFWTRIWFQCRKCGSTKFLSELDLDKINSYPLDQINFPPGFDSKRMRVTRLTNK